MKAGNGGRSVRVVGLDARILGSRRDGHPQGLGSARVDQSQVAIHLLDQFLEDPPVQFLQQLPFDLGQFLTLALLFKSGRSFS